MNSFCFVHAADLHLDTPFRGFRPTSAVRDALRDASFASWDSLVDLTLRRRAAFLFLAGDIYDGAERGVRAQFRFLRGLERLASEGIPVFIVHGNHDPLGGWSAIRAWPPNVTVFGSEGVSRIALPGVTIHGMSYPRRDVTENLALRFQRGPEPGLHFALLHANAGDVPEHAAYSPCSVDDLVAAGMDYWALGHVHRHGVLREGHPWIVYPGCLQGRSVHAGERGPKGAVVVEVDHGRISTPEFVALDAVRFATFELDAGPFEDLNALREALAARGCELREANPGRGLLVQATITGRGPVHSDLGRPGALTALLDELREASAPSSPLLWWDAIQDDSRARGDLAGIRERGDFVSDLLDLADEVTRHPARMREVVATRMKALDAVRIPRDVMPEDDDALIDRALRVALDQLAAEEGGA